MCLVEPFAPQCCGRTYVKVSKVPSCPDAWPKAKCPPELCIQIGTPYSTNAKCWRCKADDAFTYGWQRDLMRPGIDRAHVVQGLEELSVGGRRKRVEEGGHCWFCNARGGCAACGADEIIPGERFEQDQQQQYEPTPNKGKRKGGIVAESAKHMGKRVKSRPVVRRSYIPSPLDSGLSNLTYSDHGISSNWQQKTPSSNDIDVYGSLLLHPGFSQSGEPSNPNNKQNTALYDISSNELSSLAPMDTVYHAGSFQNGRWVIDQVNWETNKACQLGQNIPSQEGLPAGQLYVNRPNDSLELGAYVFGAPEVPDFMQSYSDTTTQGTIDPQVLRGDCMGPGEFTVPLLVRQNPCCPCSCH
jgi:hypothetical protein